MKCFEQKKGKTVQQLDKLLEDNFNIDTGYSKQFSKNGYLWYEANLKTDEFTEMDIKFVEKIIKPYKFYSVKSVNFNFMKTTWVLR